MADEDYEQWARDGDVLAQIGCVLMAQSTEVEVRLPRELADAAVAAWQRERSDAELGQESAEQQTVRHRGAYLCLIGCSVEELGWLDQGEVVVKLDAWFIGEAFNAADEDGLLNTPG